MAEVYQPCTMGHMGSTTPLNPMRCKAGVTTNERWSRYYQCARKAGPDGWCKQHSPDVEAARQAASAAKYQADSRKWALGLYGERFITALVKIRDGDNDPRETARVALEGCQYAEQEMLEGYIDGGDPNAPEPSANRSHSYRHGFAVGRSDRAGKPAFGGATMARELAVAAIAADDHPKPGS